MGRYVLDQLMSFQDMNELADLFPAATAPTSPYTGQLWLDTSTSPAVLKRYNGASWYSITNPGDENVKVGAAGTPDYLNDSQFKRDATNHIQLNDTSKLRVYLSSSQTIQDSTITKAELDTENFDTLSEYDNATNYRFTATSAGYYFITFLAQFSGMPAGTDIRVFIYRNGSNIAKQRTITASTTGETLQVCTLYYLSASDYIEGYVYHTSGGPEQVISGESATVLTVHRVLP